MKELKSFLKKFTWIIVAVGISVFFIVALSVYIKVEPNNVTELLNRDNTWLSPEQLSSTSGDLEAYPYVTKVYEYVINGDDLSIEFLSQSYNAKMTYGIVEDSSAKYNYYVECFVYSSIADKSLVKRTWGISIKEGDTLLFTETNAPYIARRWFDSYGDIKKKGGDDFVWYVTFMRITVKPGCNNIVFSNNK